MELSIATQDKFLDLINLFLNNPTYELEAKYKGAVTKDSFTRCIQYCKSHKMKEEIHQETMDVVTRVGSTDVYRITLKGKDTITSVFKTNMLPNTNVSFMKKSFIKGVRPILVDEMYFKIDLKDEQNVDEQVQGEISLKYPSLDKGFRFKKRYSYIDDDNNLRYDFTMVRTSNYVGTEFMAFKNMAQSQVLASKETFEIEIEMLRENTIAKQKRKTKNVLAKAMMASICGIHLSIIDEKHFMSAEDKAQVLRNYFALCYAKDNNSINTILKNAAFKPKDYFLGPQPVTLERKNVIEPGLGIVSIVQDYTVTEKADGERYLLYVNNDGKCYLINNRLSIKYTGVKLNRIVNSLFDGELITQDVMGRKANMFGMFDVYFYNSSDVRSFPLINDDNREKSRTFVMNNFSKQFEETFKQHGMVLFAKEFKHGDNIFELSKQMLDKHTAGMYPYKIDGLVYTPKYYAVGAQFAKDTPNATKTWEMVFKWKPPHDNTIDFLVKYDRDNIGNHSLVIKDDSYHKIVSLFVGYNPAVHERLTAKKYLTNDVKMNKTYVPKEFLPGDVVDESISKAYLLVEPSTIVTSTTSNYSKVTPKCINGDVIEDNSIVEFAYNPAKGSSLSQHWVPLRVRHDKTEMLRKFGLSHTANDHNTAMNVWSSIQNPVTTEIISGIQKINASDIVDEDVYFSSTLDRYKYASIVMKNFHNEFIKKRELIMKMPKGASLFDIACGKGGDIKKWIDAGFTKVMGIDVVRDNIENRKNGAYARTLEAQKKFNFDHNKTPYVYITADASKRITHEYIENMEDADDKYIFKMLWGLTPPSQIKDPSLTRYQNFMKGGFDVISCQFAIHYFFENETILDNFIFNISNNLKQGGYFIGTCLDGYAIKQKLSNIKKGESVQGTRDDRVLWNIKKLYEKNDKIKLGEQIEIFMESIGKPIKEYLVDFNLLKAKMNEKGIDVLHVEDCSKFGIDKSIDSFKASYLRLVGSSDNSQLAKDIRQMSEQEKEYSFLNSWFIFRRY
jgi:SAM-dependent methyltransferase